MPERPGPVLLPLTNRAVCRVGLSRFVPYLRLEFWGKGVPNSASGRDYVLEVSGPFHLFLAETERLIRPPDVGDATCAWLTQQKVVSAAASRLGGLEVTFGGGRLAIDPGEFEAWELADADGTRVVSVAGGGLVRWPERRIRSD